MNNTKNPGTDYLDHFKPLEVTVRGGTGDKRKDFDDFNFALKTFKSMVQKEKVISEYKQRRYHEKPSDKRRRKEKESEKKRFALEVKQKMINSGEWDKRQKRKQSRQRQKED